MAGVDREAVVFGGSGLVGRHLLQQALAADWRLHALSRSARVDKAEPGPAWQCGPQFDLDHGSGPWPDAPVLFSVGPLVSLVDWLLRTRPARLRCLVALGSTSAVTKQASPDPAERALAQRLLQAERHLADYCERSGVRWTVLRPTLIWGDGRDRNLCRIAAMARRWRCLLLPHFATGLRQPVHAREVAAAVLAAASLPAAGNRILDLPGGETLAYPAMVRRVAAVLQPPVPVRIVPVPGLRGVLAGACRLRLLAPARYAAIQRLGQDLVFDGAPAQAALRWHPGPFAPTAADFIAA